jgi:hypothetical protein
MSHATVKLLSDKKLKDVDRPIVATFGEGRPPTDVTFQSFVKESKKGEERILFGETEHMRFEAGNDNALGELETTRPAYKKRKLVQYAVGIYDEKSKTVEVCPLEQVYEIHQRSKKRIRDTEEEDEKDINEKRKAYLTNFGASSFKKTVLQYQKYGMDIITKHVAVTGKDMAAARHKTAFTNLIALLPPFNVDAKTPEEIYPIKKIIPGAEFGTIKLDPRLIAMMSNKQEKKVKGEHSESTVRATFRTPVTKQQLVEFFNGFEIKNEKITVQDKEALIEFRSIEEAKRAIKQKAGHKIGNVNVNLKRANQTGLIDETIPLELPQIVAEIIEKHKKAKNWAWLENKSNRFAVQYLLHLFAFARAPERFNLSALCDTYYGGSGLAKVPYGWAPSSNQLAEYMGNEFGAVTDRFCKRNAEHVGKLICYILALSLNLAGFKMSSKNFVKDLGKSEKELKPYFKALGCRGNDNFRETNVENANYTLSAPLKNSFVNELRQRQKQDKE